MECQSDEVATWMLGQLVTSTFLYKETIDACYNVAVDNYKIPVTVSKEETIKVVRTALSYLEGK